MHLFLPTRLLLSFLLIFILLSAKSQSQNTWDCADDKLIALERIISPAFDKIQEQNNRQIKEYVNGFLQNKNKPIFNGRVSLDSIYTIPVVVHVIYPVGEAYGAGSNISYAQIRSQLEALNAAFSKNYPAYNGQTPPGYAVDTRIRFCLARTATDTSSWSSGPGGTEFGVKRYADNSGAYNHDITLFSANQLLKITHPNSSRFPFEKYLNIWLVKTIGGGNNVMGYAPRPIMSGYPLDGVVMRADIFGDNTTGGNYPLGGFGLTQGKVLAHEVGHYLNLYHIFQGGCSGTNGAGASNDACDLNGDFICDIEPATTQNVYCNTANNTCTANYNSGTTNLDMINDYMSYADDDCMNTFTLNQSQRMWATLNLERQKLWQPENLVATGVLGTNGCVPPYLNAQINTDNAVFCINKPIVFSNPTAGNTAKNYQWQFPGGSPASANTNSATVTYGATGNYKAILRVSDRTNLRTDSLLFTILDCKLDSSMLHMSHWYFSDYCSIDFSSGAPVQTNTALGKNTIHGESAYPGQLPYSGSTISLSDSTGNLLFYSNGVSVWNGNHQKITTSPMFGVSDINASTGLCYIPYPGNANKYFIAGVYPNFDESPSGIRYVMVDVSTNTITPYKEFQNSSLPKRFSEFMTVVPHCNGTDYWIIAHGEGWTNNNRFYSFLVTASGINNNQIPIISSGFIHPGYGGDGNQLKANRRGDKLILLSPHGYINIEAGTLYDFDNRTGLITNEKIIPNVNGYNNIQGGGSFSPNGEYFYLMRSTNLATNGPPYWMFQYRISDFHYNILATTGFYYGSSYQLGPDNQLYITNGGYNSLARLSNPDVWGGASFNGNFMNFSEPSFSRRMRSSLPAFIDARQPQPTHPEFTIKAINCNTYSISSICFDNYISTWNFGDGSPLQTGNNIVHTFLQAGEFSVTLTLSNNVKIFGSATKKIIILPITISITGPDSVCSNHNYSSQYFAQKSLGVNYKWSVVNGTISGPDNLEFVSVVWTSGNSNGKLILEISRDNCILKTEKTITIIQSPVIKWIVKDNVCIYDSSFSFTATPAAGTYTGKGIRNNIFSPSMAGIGTHTITYTYTNEFNCYAQTEKYIKVLSCSPTYRPPVTINCEEILNSIRLSSNPVNEVVELKSPYTFKFAQIYNLTGEKITENFLVNNKMSLSLVSSGIYILRVYCDKQQTFKSFRIIKLK